MTKSQAAIIFDTLVDAFPNTKATSGTRELYEKFLVKLDHDAVKQAVVSLIASDREFIPTIGQVVSATLNITAGPQKRGGEAWAEVMEATGTVGHYGDPEFADPVTTAVVRAFGWRELCLSQNLASDRAQFIALYDLWAGRQREAAQSGHALPPVQHKEPRGLEAKKESAPRDTSRRPALSAPQKLSTDEMLGFINQATAALKGKS